MRACGRQLLLSGVLLLLPACSLIVEFDPELKPCTERGECLAGYSCMVTQCVRDGSLSEGDTCFRNRMCGGDLVCAVPEFVCRRPCSSAFGDNEDCGPGSACVGTRDSEELFVGACLPSECNANTDPCDADSDGNPRVCVQLTTTVGICMYPCTFNCAGAPPCTDTCSGGRVCHPVGTDETLACIEPGDVPVNIACDLSSDRCSAGLACLLTDGGGSTGTCRTICDDPADCTGGATCTPRPTAYSVCLGP